MNLEAILRRLWPILKPRVIVALTRLIQRIAPDVPDAEAADIAIFIVGLVEGLLPAELPPADATLLASVTARLSGRDA